MGKKTFCKRQRGLASAFASAAFISAAFLLLKVAVRQAGGSHLFAQPFNTAFGWRGTPTLSRLAKLRRSGHGAEVDTIIFDIDDTLYPVSSGLSEHRMGEVTQKFMVERLGFDSPEKAKQVWSEYIVRYHSTLKGLAVAGQEGRLPRPFKQEELGEFWAKHTNFTGYLTPDPDLIEMMRSLRDDADMKLVVFTNAPRLYALRCLDILGIRDFFPHDRIFAVEDVLPACKPEKEAFQKVLRSVGSLPERAVMFEDSMKNIRACHDLGMHTVLIQENADAMTGEAALVGDAPQPDDPAVGAVLRRAADARTLLPDLWHGKFPMADAKQR